MKNAVAVLLALLLICSLPVTVAVASAPAAEREANEAGLVEIDGTTNRLALGEDVHREYASPGPDMASTLAAGDAELRVDQERFVVDRGFGDASESEQRERIEAALDRIDERIRALEARERHAVARHANGEISDTTLVQVMVANYNEAGEISDMLDELNDRRQVISSVYSETKAIRDTIRYEENRLGRYRSPLRSSLDAISRERVAANDAPLVIDTRANGYRLAVIRESTYVYEIARFDNRNETRPDGFDGLTEAEDYAEEVYPWAHETTGKSFNAMFPYGLYRLQVPHDHGTLEAYFDGGTRAVTYETQELSIGELPTSATDRTWEGDDLTLSLNETPADGPVEVTVTDSGTGEPVDATVAVDGTVVGGTGGDGTRWIVPPIGEYELIAETDDASANATIAAG